MVDPLFSAFVRKRMLVAYLSLIPTGSLAAYTAFSMSSYLALVAFTVQLTLVAFGSYLMFGTYKNEIATDERNFIKKLRIFITQFRERITSLNYTYSITNFATQVATNSSVQSYTRAWSIAVPNCCTDLFYDATALEEKAKDATIFISVFKDFESLLTELVSFKDRYFASMIVELRGKSLLVNDDVNAATYAKVKEEYDKFVDEVRSFSLDTQVKFSLFLREDLVRHLPAYYSIGSPQN